MNPKYVSILAISIIALFLINGCGQKNTSSPQPTEQVLEQITLNVCQTDPENADYWPTTKVNLFNKPGGIATGAVKSGELPPCSSITLDVLDKQTIEGIESYKVRYNNIVGWQTKRLLVGESNAEKEEEKSTKIESPKSDEVVLTQELKDEICYEMDTYIEYCYGQGNPLDQCASETLEKVKRIYGITEQQFLEVNEYCYP